MESSIASNYQRCAPILLVYPSVFERLSAARHEDDMNMAYLMAKCCSLVRDRPREASRQFAGYHTKSGGMLFVVWGRYEADPDIFILSGPGEGFGPGHTCPSKEELRQGHYCSLIEVPLLV